MDAKMYSKMPTEFFFSGSGWPTISELMMLCGSVDQTVIFATLLICCLLRASAAYVDAMYVIVVCCQALALNDALYLLMWAIVRAY